MQLTCEVHSELHSANTLYLLAPGGIIILNLAS